MKSAEPSLFEIIDRFHSDWSHVDKMSRLGWLTGEKLRLEGLINQMAAYIRAKGAPLNELEKAYAQRLLDMIQMVDNEGTNVVNDLRVEALRELAKF